jgi:peroxiredoxin
LAVVLTLSVAATGLADKFNKKVDIGDAAPVWSGIMGTDDAEHSLSDYKDAKAIVQIFTCNHCPVAVSYEDRLVELQKDYAERGVQLVAINVNNMEADRLPAMKRRAESKGFNFPYLYDESQQTAVECGANVTPHVFVLDGQRKIAYMGAIDDNWNDASKVNKHYLRDALEAVLAGETPAVVSTKAQGCGIMYEK